ncbi:MAG: hypothetical protein ACP5T0_00095 [Verrucomicrobiia bacterium]
MKIKVTILLVFLSVLIKFNTALGQHTINYYKPDNEIYCFFFNLLRERGEKKIDINLDGVYDYAFVSGVNCVNFKALGNNQFILNQIGVVPIVDGQEISAVLDDGFYWSTNSALLGALVFGGVSDSNFEFFSQFHNCENENCTNYIGIRIYMSDGYHYGWIKAKSIFMMPGVQVLDWAFESRPNKFIKAGAKPVAASMTSPQIYRSSYLRIGWQAETGKTYQIQYKDDLNYPWWTNLDFAVPATSQEMFIELPLDKNARFFRVIEAEPEIHPALETLTPPKIIPFK